MLKHTIHIIWGDQAVTRMRAGVVDNLVRLAHASYDFASAKDASAFLLGVGEMRSPASWMQVQSVGEIAKLGQPLRARLFTAIERGDVATVEVLIASGVSPNARAQDGLSALHLAARLAKPLVVAALLERGADPSLTLPDSKETALHLACASQAEGSQIVAGQLVHAGADIDAFDSSRKTPLVHALDASRLHVATYLVSQRASLDLEDVTGQSARRAYLEKFAAVINDPAVEAFATAISQSDDIDEKDRIRRSRSLIPTPYN